MKMKKLIRWRFVVYPEGTWYIAQGLDHYVVAQARSLDELPHEITRVVVANVLLAAKHGKDLADPEHCTKAPQELWDLFEKIEATIVATCSDRTFVSTDIPEEEIKVEAEILFSAQC